MASTSPPPQGIPKTITPTNRSATDPLDQGDGVPEPQPRPAAQGADLEAAGRPSARSADRSSGPAARDSTPSGRQPSDAAPPEAADDSPLESLGKAISAPVREAGRSPSGGGGGSPR